MATEIANKRAEREALRGVIQQWNANRLDLFELSEPNEVRFTTKQSKEEKVGEGWGGGIGGDGKRTEWKKEKRKVKGKREKRVNLTDLS